MENHWKNWIQLKTSENMLWIDIENHWEWGKTSPLRHIHIACRALKGCWGVKGCQKNQCISKSAFFCVIQDDLTELTAHLLISFGKTWVFTRHALLKREKRLQKARLKCQGHRYLRSLLLRGISAENCLRVKASHESRHVETSRDDWIRIYQATESQSPHSV